MQTDLTSNGGLKGKHRMQTTSTIITPWGYIINKKTPFLEK
jgi:hypothetical protein